MGCAVPAFTTCKPVLTWHGGQGANQANGGDTHDKRKGREGKAAPFWISMSDLIPFVLHPTTPATIFYPSLLT